MMHTTSHKKSLSITVPSKRLEQWWIVMGCLATGLLHKAVNVGAKRDFWLMDSTLLGISYWWDCMVLLLYAFPPMFWMVYFTVSYLLQNEHVRAKPVEKEHACFKNKALLFLFFFLIYIHVYINTDTCNWLNQLTRRDCNGKFKTYTGITLWSHGRREGCHGKRLQHSTCMSEHKARQWATM